MRILPSLASCVLAFIATACLADEEVDHADEDAALYEQAYEDGQAEGKTDGTDCSGVRVPDRNGFAKRIALTFDDGPNPATTPEQQGFTFVRLDDRAAFPKLHMPTP